MPLTHNDIPLEGEGGTPAKAQATPWSGLHSRLLDALEPTAQARILDLSACIVQSLDRWAARYPLIRRVRIWPLALSLAAADPFARVDELISTARVSLWVFTLDDLFDEDPLPQLVLFRRAEEYCAIARDGTPVAPDDSLAEALGEIRADLAMYPLFGPLGGEWTEALCGTIAGMVRESHWRVNYQQDANAALPSYDEYLRNGRYSIGGPPHVWATLITAGDPSTPSHIEHLSKMEHIASICIRLANDLQSYAKEVAEGKCNALMLLSRGLEQKGILAVEAHERAEAQIRRDIDSGLRQLQVLQAEGGTDTGRPEAAIAGIARFVCDFYQHHDYHTFGAQAS